MPGIADGGLDAIGRWDRKAGAVEVWVHRPQAQGALQPICDVSAS